MREHKYRAWDSHRKCMIEWNELGALDEGLHLSLWNVLTGQVKHIIPMEYTGLKDSEGRDIYEGDILSDKEGDNYHITVVWSEQELRFGVTENGGNIVYHISQKIVGEKYRIIGNIHETPELLK